MSCYFTLGPLSIGDCGPEQKNIIKNETINQSLTNVATNSMTNRERSDIVSQELNVNILGAGQECCSNISIFQGIKMNKKEETNINEEFVTNIKNNLETEIKQGLEAFLESTKEDIASESQAKLRNEMTNFVKQSIQNNINVASMKNIASKTITKQGANINIQCADYTSRITGKVAYPLKDTNCTVNQDTLMELFSNDVIKTVFKNVASNQSLVKAIQECASQMKVKATGLKSIIDSIMSGFIIWIIVGGIVLISLIFLGPRLISSFKGNKSSIPKIAKEIPLVAGRLLYNRH
jgi:hypothetical protein